MSRSVSSTSPYELRDNRISAMGTQGLKPSRLTSTHGMPTDQSPRVSDVDLDSAERPSQECAKG